jgi:hypothetical protein
MMMKSNMRIKDLKDFQELATNKKVSNEQIIRLFPRYAIFVEEPELKQKAEDAYNRYASKHGLETV